VACASTDRNPSATWVRGCAPQARDPQHRLVGDFNIAPEDRDAHEPAKRRGSLHSFEPERSARAGRAGFGLVDGLGLIAARCTGSRIDREPRRAERLSDQPPSMATFDI
jgi:exodeoxyribonuclease III